MGRSLEKRANLERAIAAYFKGLLAKAAAEEAELESVLSAASEEIDFGPAVSQFLGQGK